MLVDGRLIAADMYRALANQVTHLDTRPHLTVFTCAPNFETQKYLELKKRKAEAIGVAMNVVELPETLTTEEVVQSVLYAQMQTDGIIVQLPLPAHIDTDVVLQAIPASYDTDGMHYDGTDATYMSPVVGAIAEIVARHDVMLAAQKVVVVGHGRLVGKPAEIWAQKQGAQVTVVTKETGDLVAAVAKADILILGAGTPNLITPDMIKDGVVIFDAGTSEDGGELRGDADPACAEKASLYTPVPGGIGPITIAMLLRNLVNPTTRR